MELAGADIFHSHLPGPASRPIAATLRRDRSHPMMDPTTPPRHDEFTTRENAKNPAARVESPVAGAGLVPGSTTITRGNSRTVEPERSFPRGRWMPTLAWACF